MQSCWWNFLLVAGFVLSLIVDESGAIKFDFGTLTLGSLKLLGDAHLKNGSIRLTRDLPVPNSGAGRALFAYPLLFRHPATRAPIPFSTFFSFSITNLNPDSIGGGLAFLLTSDDRAVGDAGGFLGLINASASADGSPLPTVIAIEFDTLMDVEFEDINANHVGVDIGNLVSAKAADLDAAGIDLKSGEIIHAWVDYGADQLSVFVSYSTERPAVPVLSYSIDLGRFVDDVMYVGFSGSTQGSTEIHSIDWWSFSSTSSSSPPPPINSKPPPQSTPSTSMAPSISVSVTAQAPFNGSISPNPPSSSCQTNSLCRQGPAAVAGVATAGAFFIAACAGVGIWAFSYKRTRQQTRKWHNTTAAEIVNSPREFSYRELTAATRGFDPSRIIGHGAFGTVYKGIVPETGAMIAVKRCLSSNNSAQAREEFLSELSIIASLRHRNLVRLQGWCCHEKGEILLVYDFMINGSLDKALFDPRSPPLAWRHRKEILAGVASALAYLHRECDRQVIHRDVKSSNVMLDNGFHARLGDFGLARQVEHDKSPDATVTAGTMGYLAPEYLLTGRATEKTDAFSFGVLALEVASGRRPIATTCDGDAIANAAVVRKFKNLVGWVWMLHGEGRLLEAADEKLCGEFDEGEMRKVLLVGLACSSPDAVMRPGMRTVVQILTGEAEAPVVPTTRPSTSFSTNQHLLLSLQDSVSDFNALGLNMSTSSSSSSSLISTLRGGGGS